MKPISRTAAAVTPSVTLEVDALAKRMKAEGKAVIGFGAGEPDYDTPQYIKEAAVRAIMAGKTKYTPAAGLAELQKAAAARLESDCGIFYEPSQIVVASGAKHSIFVALMCLVNPGDEVILPAPYWVTYSESIRMAGGVPVVIDTEESADFKLTPAQLDAAVTDKTKLVIINNPSNPTGMLYNRGELSALADVCVRHDLYIMADEIYYKLIYGDKQFVSIASLGDEVQKRTIIVNGVSKTYAMTGWRIGYTASSVELARVMSGYLSHSTSAPSTISQYAAIEALNAPQDSVEEMRRVFKKRRDYIVERVNAIPGLSCITPDGAFYVMLNMKQQIGKTLGGRYIANENDFAIALLESVYVALVPCGAFGAPGFLRTTYAASFENIEEGFNRIEKLIRSSD